MMNKMIMYLIPSRKKGNGTEERRIRHREINQYREYREYEREITKGFTTDTMWVKSCSNKE